MGCGGLNKCISKSPGQSILDSFNYDFKKPEIVFAGCAVGRRSILTYDPIGGTSGVVSALRVSRFYCFAWCLTAFVNNTC